MSDGIYLFLQNVQIATMLISFVSILLCAVALVFFIIMMFYGIKVAKIYIREHGTNKKEKTANTDATLESGNEPALGIEAEEEAEEKEE